MQAKAEHDQEEEDGKQELDEIGRITLQLVVATPDGAQQNRGEGEKEKADDLVP